jgi:hypothetical protein
MTCDYVLTYRVGDGDTAHFEMSATAGWVAVGFSSDDRMVSCSHLASALSWKWRQKWFWFTGTNSMLLPSLMSAAIFSL